jgi:O-succinylbenzoate synthase
MSAEPVRDEDPSDPEVILRDLPERERAEFLRQYHQAIEAARDPAGYGRLRRLLHTWRLIAVAASQPGYYEALKAVRDGVVRTTPAEEAIPDWQERLAAARAARQ